MDPHLHPIAAALADDDLRALIASANAAPQITPGRLAWLEHAADWELRRRGGVDFTLQPPAAAIDPSDDAASLTAATMLHERFAPDAPAVAALFAATVATLAETASATRH